MSTSDNTTTEDLHTWATALFAPLDAELARSRAILTAYSAEDEQKEQPSEEEPIK